MRGIAVLHAIAVLFPAALTVTCGVSIECDDRDAECAARKLRQLRNELVISMRTETIKKNILGKLGFERRPDIPKSLTREMMRKAVKTAHRNMPQLSPLRPATPDVGEISEVVAFSESVSGRPNKLRFSLHQNPRDGALNVTGVSVWVLVKCRKSAKRVKRRVQLTVSYEWKGQPVEPVYRVLYVRHTKWHQLRLSQTIVQEALDSANQTIILRMGMQCRKCGSNVSVVLARKSSRSGELNKRRPFMMIRTTLKRDRNGVRKRSIDCPQSTPACCRRSLFINFTSIGWGDWILSPAGYFANFCEGKCRTGQMLPSDLSNQHGRVLDGYNQMNNLESKNIQFCCSPLKMSPLSMLFMSDDSTVRKADIPNMIVEDCGCS